ncbi:MAG: hypothetical protein GY810_31700 [Aureispira sp.]|nr:hypothetical protein [Aureispira sp.]
MADTTTDKPSVNETINKILGGDKPLITTNNKVELNTENVLKTSLGVAGIWLLFMILLTLAKREINKGA